MFQIDFKSRTAIYAQVVENCKRLIINGVLKEDEKVPSVRELAQTLTANPNTIQKAYRELESQGYIYTVPGQGSFIAAPPQARADKDALYQRLTETARELLFIGETAREILRAVSVAVDGKEAQ